jgi:hypothetical protein
MDLASAIRSLDSRRGSCRGTASCRRGVHRRARRTRHCYSHRRRDPFCPRRARRDRVEGHSVVTDGRSWVPDVVRPHTLSPALTARLRIGDAIEVLRLLQQAGVCVGLTDLEVLRDTAELLLRLASRTPSTPMAACRCRRWAGSSVARAPVAPRRRSTKRSYRRRWGRTGHRSARP